MSEEYTNITLQGPGQAQVAEYLTELRRTAFVAPTANGYTVVWDQASGTRGDRALGRLAALLSGRFRCAALAARGRPNAFRYQVYRGGRFIDDYDSTPDFFVGKRALPRSGDAKKLSHAFHTDEAAGSVERILRHPGYVGVNQHLDLIEALGLPTVAAGTSYDDLAAGPAPDEGLDALDRGQLIFVPGEDLPPTWDLLLLGVGPGMEARQVRDWLGGEGRIGSSLGSAERVWEILADLMPDADFSDPAWVVWHARDFSLELDLGHRDPIEFITLHAAGPPEAMSAAGAAIGRIGRRTGWRAFDPAGGEFWEPVAPQITLGAFAPGEDGGGVALADRRGTLAAVGDHRVVLVRAGVEETAGALAAEREARRHERDVAGVEVTLTDQGFWVFRLRGHTWSLIVDRMEARYGLTADDARALSLALETPAIYYATASESWTYHFYDDAELQEQLETDPQTDLLFESRRRAVEASEIEDVPAFVDDFFAAQDALEPGLSFAHLAGRWDTRPGDRIIPADSGEIERIDFVAL